MDEQKRQPDRRGDRRSGGAWCQHRIRSSRDSLSRTKPCDGPLYARAGTDLLECESCGTIDRRQANPRRRRPGLQLVADFGPRLQVLGQRLEQLEALQEADGHSVSVAKVERETLRIELTTLRERLDRLEERPGLRISPELERATLEQLPQLEQRVRDLALERLPHFEARLEDLNRDKWGVEDGRHLNRKLAELYTRVGIDAELVGLSGSLAAVVKQLDHKLEGIRAIVLEARATALSALESAEMARTGHAAPKRKRSRGSK